ncbi:MAG: glycosyltransferase family 2 protein [Gammaproteobacteria bacterium]|nr:glycosyltransferase family 2 protein [Gammaproteobacteria bacterium]
MKTITVLIPVFNEEGAIEKNLPVIVNYIETIDNVELGILIVDDGSTDNTSAWIREFCGQHDKVSLLCLNRNFGKESAIHAGLEQSRREDAVIVMDSDLQHPPELIPRMIELWLKGFQVVEACKSSRGREAPASRFFANGFYWIFNMLAGIDLKNHSDFKLLDKQVVNLYCALPERKRFFRGMINWMGFLSTQLFFDVPERIHGATAWSRFKLLRFSLSAIIGFSSSPLHLVSLMGVVCFFVSIIMGGIALYDKFTGHAVSGFTTVILLILFIGSLLMFALGLIGVYLERIFDEIKRRPTYLIDYKKSRIKEKT